MTISMTMMITRLAMLWTERQRIRVIFDDDDDD